MSKTSAASIYEASCALEALTSLLLTLIDQIGEIAEHLDPLRAAKIAADLARIAHECLVATRDKLASLAA